PSRVGAALLRVVQAGKPDHRFTGLVRRTGVLCDAGAYRSLVSRPLSRLARWKRTQRLYSSTGAGAGVRHSQGEWAGLQRRSGLLRSMVSPERLPHTQVDLHATHSGGAVDDRWSGVDALYAATARNLTVPCYCGCLRPGGTSAAALAHRDGRELRALE